VGHRMKLSYTRALLQAALSGALPSTSFTPDPVFGVLVPQACPGVPSEVLRPRATWRDPAAYDAKARDLASLFQRNFQTHATHATEAVRAAGPRL
jgi:phosphoenolpyruvate carboxykinase (ATP)